MNRCARVLTWATWIGALSLVCGCTPQPASKPSSSQTALATESELLPTAATIETNMGTIKIRLFPEKAPHSVANFARYARSGHYNGTIFHRVIDGFMIQAGGHLPDLSARLENFPPVKNEANNGLSNLSMTVAFARGDDPDSARAQFYINQVDNVYLDYTPGQSAGYTVFGEVTEGFDVVHQIASVPTVVQGEFQALPKKTVVIQSVTLDSSDEGDNASQQDTQ
ncbi:MAG: peptidylprolyl isomerase [Planctomycetales bacterium]|nr:peptidylprolyl isomerase [Planctomycetales bacterium]